MDLLQFFGGDTEKTGIQLAVFVQSLIDRDSAYSPRGMSSVNSNVASYRSAMIPLKVFFMNVESEL